MEIKILSLIFIVPLVLLMSFVHTSFAEPNIKDFEECVVGNYSHSFHVGSWNVSIKKQESGHCYMLITTEIEGGWSEDFCKLVLGEFKASDWNTSWKPLKEDPKHICYQIRDGIVFFEQTNVHVSPKFQVKIGMESEDVICKNGLKLIFKAANNNPACVKPESVTKLLERGWAAPI